MPTKRRQNTPGKAPRTVRGAREPQRTRAGSGSYGSLGARARQGAHATRAKKPGFSTSAPAGSAFRKASGAGTRPSVSNSFVGTVGVAGGSGKKRPEVLLTRRNLVIGAAAVGGVAVLGGGISAAMGALDSGSSDAPATLSVPAESVAASTDYTLVEDTSTCVSVAGNYKLPYGTLVWADNDVVAACLVPGESASPLNTVRALYLANGNTVEVLKSAQGASDGYEIFDVRCSEEGVVWTECNSYTSSWRVFSAPLTSSGAGDAQKLDEGDGSWLIPSLAAIGDKAFWQIDPNTSGAAATERSVLKAAVFGTAEGREVYSSKRAFATRVAAATDGVVITPRADTTGTYYQLVKIDAASLSASDSLILPASMTPDLASYGKSGFSFGFSSIYSYGGGIANLGTYTPRSAANPYHYDDLQWFRFARTPITAPCWCGDWFVVKSTTALCGINFASQSYFALDVTSGADDYGEHLVSSGTCQAFVGLTQITSDKTGEDDYALVRVVKPVSSATSGAF